jgi:outer membrane protein OmpA-like peptidoglycan-associated protein/tetratricopeptide (TPR) repeat protein
MKQLSLLIILIVQCGILFSQNVEFKAGNFKDNKEGLKEAQANIKAADEITGAANKAFLEMKENENDYKKALSLYLKANTFNPENAELNMKIGNCYLFTNEKYKAKKYLEKALKLDAQVSEMIDFYLAQAYQLSSEWDKAIEHYEKFKNSKKGEEYKTFVSQYIKGCKSGKEMSAKPLRVWVDNLQELNSEEDDYSPCISADGEFMIFTSKRSNGHAKNELGEYDSDIYTSSLTNKKWTSPKNVGSPLSTEQDETAASLSYDGQRMLAYIVENGNADVYESKLKGNDWEKPKRKMSDNNNTTANETFACYEPLDIKVYYITDGGSTGGKNIFMSGVGVKEKNLWGLGQSGGHMINTKFHEGSVFVHPDGKTIYFSSQGHNSMGGYDIFKAELKGGQWSDPVNLGYPINSPYDDLFFASTASGKYAYIASNREGGKGKMDLYKVTFWGPEKQVLVDSEDFLLASIAKPIKDINIEKAVEVEKKSLTVFKGVVIDAISRKPLEALIEILDNSSGEQIATFNSNSATGKFLLSLPSGRNYGISVRKDGYLFHSENFNLPSESEFNLVEKDVELKNIAIGSKIALRNVFYATGKSDITPDSYPELDRLVKLMNDVPSLKVEISGHTDNIGSETTNQKLSEDRANSVVSYLSKKGVTSSRLAGKGYGSSKPVASNNSEDGRQQNRRTEFEITGN